jgi:signal transduction histidine kinase
LQKEKEIQRKIIKTEKYARFFGVGFTLILLLFIFQLFRSNTSKNKLNQQLSIQNAAVNDQNHLLEGLNETKNVLFSIIGHDLRGPFAYLLSMIDLMKDKEISVDEQEYFLAKLSENIHVTDHLLNNLLYWAKSQMEGMVTSPVTFDVQLVINDNINLLRSRGDNKGIKITQQGTPLSQSVYADKAMIDLIIRNLLENALKFSSQGDTIQVKASDDEKFLRLSIIDSGKGIPLEDQSKIFNKLKSFTTYGTGNEKGSGLGLLLCKELIEKNYGTIWFESSPGHGSTFNITIPKS